MQQVVSFLPSPPGRLTHLGHGSAALHGADTLLSTDPLCSFPGAAQPADRAVCPHMLSSPVFRALEGR
jgi:hypothetical protein